MIPRPGGAAEDDGAVLSVVTSADGKSFLLVLDAGSFEEVARAHLDFAIPYQFHGEGCSAVCCLPQGRFSRRWSCDLGFSL